jgi:electron transport complex protein RnfB
MSVNDSEVYRELQKHLDELPVGFPETKSGVEIRLLKQLFSPIEAKIAMKLNYIPEKLKTIYRRVKSSGMSIDELEKILNEMFKKGTINSGEQEGEKFYGNAVWAVGIYEYQLNRLTKEFFNDNEQFFNEGFLEEFLRIKPQLRTIPIEQSITPEYIVATYNDIREIINICGEPIAVAECICRKGKKLVGDPCKQTKMLEVCFSFRSAAQFYIDKGFGRQISKEEALKIFEKAEKDGLILQPGNSQKPNFICCCCGCCCGILSNAKKSEKLTELLATSYHAEVDIDLCTGCGTCVDRCQMDALTLIDDISVVNLKRCIGCGNCVPTCPSEAIKLQENEKKIIPPENTYTLYMELMEKKAEMNRVKIKETPQT